MKRSFARRTRTRKRNNNKQNLNKVHNLSLLFRKVWKVKCGIRVYENAGEARGKGISVKGSSATKEFEVERNHL